MGDKTGKQNWHVLRFSFGPDSYIEFLLLQYYSTLCKPGFRLSWEEVGGRE